MMNWRIKALTQKVLSLTKIGDRLNHSSVLLNKNYHLNVYKYQTYECLRKINDCNIIIKKDSKALEIGTGYTLLPSICLSLLGFETIITVDITKDLRYSSFKKQIKHLELSSLPEGFISKSIFSEEEITERIKMIKGAKSLKDIFNFLNIQYIAPYEFSDIENKCSAFDYITSQVVLEHIPPFKLNSLFNYTNKWLLPEGFAVHCINFIDHFANPGFFQDKSISEFNFLKYSDRFWAFWAGNSIAYTNRLSYLYYIELASKHSLTVINFKGHNYRKRIELNTDLIHNDILKKYQNNYNLEELTKYQRGTLILKK